MSDETELLQPMYAVCKHTLVTASPVRSPRLFRIRPGHTTPAKRRWLLVARALKSDVEKRIEEAIKNAEVICDEASSQDCSAAWDLVEELCTTSDLGTLSAGQLAADPLEKFCKSNPAADECRLYDE